MWTHDRSQRRRSLLGRVGNRKLRQRRRLRPILPSTAELAGVAGRAIARVAPLLLAVSIAAFTASLAVLGYRFVRTSPRFAVTDVIVRGALRAREADLVRLAGVAPGSNLFSVSMRSVEARVAASPWIASVKAERRIPHKIVLHVIERTPVAVVVLDAPYLTDATGRPFKRARLGEDAAQGLVLVTGLERALFTRDPDAAAGRVRSALSIAARWRVSPARPELGEIRLEPDATIAYTRDGAVAVRLGLDPEPDLDERLQRFDAVWAALSPEERALARRIHLDSLTRPDRVTVRLADAR